MRVLHRSFPRQVPQWYFRGIAEVISNTFVREKELQVGRPVQGNLDVMRSRAPVPLGEFDAQAWALVHYLMFGEEGRNAPKVDRFNRLLHEGLGRRSPSRRPSGTWRPTTKEVQQFLDFAARRP